MSEEKKERPQLGLAIPVTNKAKSSSYDLKGNIVIDGKSYRFGAYKAQASGKGKMAEGQEYFYFHRVEPMEDAAAAPTAGATDFDPKELEAYYGCRQVQISCYQHKDLQVT